MFSVNGIMFLVKGNMFCVNGKLFLVSGKPFINKSHITCGFLIYAFLKQLHLEIAYQMLKHITSTLK